jgi:nucleotide-binding universal stress UspA family protein
MPPPYRHILAPTDFSAAARVGVDEAVALARTFGAALTILHAYELPGYVYLGMAYGDAGALVRLEQTARTLLAREVDEVRKAEPSVGAVLAEGAAADAVVDRARALDADLVVLSSHGRTGVTRAVLGSVAEKVVRLCPVPVLVVKAPRSA